MEHKGNSKFYVVIVRRVYKLVVRFTTTAFKKSQENINSINNQEHFDRDN